MDTALTLRMKAETGQQTPDREIDSLLQESALVGKLTANYLEHPLFAVFRIMGLSEIPCVERLPYTQQLLGYIDTNLATPEGFSCLGSVKEIVPCYNAMLLEAYSRLGLASAAEAQAALRWIKRYQLFDRNQVTAWPHGGVCKHGGCLGKIPCYIGIGKTVRALITYAETTRGEDAEAEALITSGIEYMLRHSMYRRLSGGEPISSHITDIMMPQSYALSLTDLVYIAGRRKLTCDDRTAPLLHLLREKAVGENRWKIDYLYSYKGYVGYEGRRKPSEWISALFPLWLST